MSQRDVVGEYAPPNEDDNLVELNRAATVNVASSEHQPHAQSLSEAIKDKHEQTNSSKSASPKLYLVIFQWMLLIFCVLSNIYLLSKPEIKCECDGSSAESLRINPSTLHPSLQPTPGPYVNPTISPSSQPTAVPSTVPSRDPTLSPSQPTAVMPSMYPTSDPTLSPSSQPTAAPSVVPSQDPTLSPSIQPTKSPSVNPSFHPTMTPTSRPTSSPSMQPSEYPSQSPTYFDGYFIADYKYSFRNASHGFWVLCHGQWLDITQYSMLFNEIGYQFGSKHDQNTNILYFRLPDARDGVMGVIGSLHQMNEHVGNETHLLSQSEIAEHDHYIVSNQGNEACTSVSNTGSSLSHSCFDTVNTDYAYTLQRSPGTPNLFQTSMVGGNQSFSVMQPTKFIGNLFMYSGIMH
eukprot:438644_1